MSNQNEILNPENVLIVGTVNEEVYKAVEDIVNDRGLTLVRLDDKVITDYIEAASKPENTSTTIDEFLSNEDNKKSAEEKALTLWNMMTGNSSVEKANERIFTKSEIVQHTTLTHKTLGELLELLNLFGFITFTKGRYEFKFVFGEETKKAEVYADIIENMMSINMNIARYKNLFGNEEEKEKAIEETKKAISEIIKF